MKRVRFLLTICLLAGSLTACQTPAQTEASPGQSASLAGSTSGIEIERYAIELANASKDGIYHLTGTQDVKEMLSTNQDMRLIDTRPFEEFEKGHLEGAVNLPVGAASLEELSEAQRETFVRELGEDTDKVLVFYGASLEDASSDVAAVLASEAGYSDVYRFPGGIKNWQEAGLSIKKP